MQNRGQVQRRLIDSTIARLARRMDRRAFVGTWLLVNSFAAAAGSIPAYYLEFPDGTGSIHRIAINSFAFGTGQANQFPGMGSLQSTNFVDVTFLDAMGIQSAGRYLNPGSLFNNIYLVSLPSATQQYWQADLIDSDILSNRAFTSAGSPESTVQIDYKSLDVTHGTTTNGGQFGGTSSSGTSVPEPPVIALMGVAATFLGIHRALRRRNRMRSHA